MSEHTPTPKLVMGYIEVVAPDGEEGIPYDEAVIHLEGDEDSEIEVHCPGALRLAPLIVKAVNNHDALVKALTDTLCELTACANQLAARGLKGHPDDSVSRAQTAARAVLGVVGGVRHD